MHEMDSEQFFYYATYRMLIYSWNKSVYLLNYMQLNTILDTILYTIHITLSLSYYPISSFI